MTTATDSASTVLGTYSYDAMARRTNLAYANGASMAYGYDDASDLTSLTDGFVNTAKKVNYTLAYTPARQLASETISKTPYAYQPSQGTDSYGAVNAVNQYASFTPAGGSALTQSYETNGNLIGDGTWTYGYDPENRMVLADKSGSSNSYAYDPTGRRQSKNAGGTVTNFLWDGDDLIAEYDGSGNVQRRYVPGPAINSPIVYEACSGTNCSTPTLEYYHTDHHGSVVAMSDATGNPAAGENQYSYDAYGVSSMATTGQPFRYVGMYLDAETGLYQDRARVYSTRNGRFLQNDPVGYKDDLDLYTYVADDPADHVDPSGLEMGAVYQRDLLGGQLPPRGDGNLVDTLNSGAQTLSNWGDAAAGLPPPEDPPLPGPPLPKLPAGAYAQITSQDIDPVTGQNVGDGTTVAEYRGQNGMDANKAGSQFGNYGSWTYGRSGRFAWKMANYHGVEGRIGVGLVVNYTGSRRVQWRQQYRVQSPFGDTGWTHDGDYPYYDSSNRLHLPVNAFWDTPTLGAGTGNYNVNWSAEDQVIDLETGRVIYTFTWGFSTNANGVITQKPPEFSK